MGEKKVKESEFGKGFVYNLILFAKRASQLKTRYARSTLADLKKG